VFIFREGEIDMIELAKDSLDLGIVVGEINTSLNFYQNILGLRFVDEMPVPSGKMHRLRVGSSDLKLIDLRTQPPKGPVGLESQLGFRYITFVIKNLSKLCIELRNKGIEFVMTEIEVRPGVHIAMIKDPDGNIVEFVERS